MPDQTDTVAHPPDDDEPSPEDPNRFGTRPEPAPLDEAPDGTTPSDPD